MSVLRPTGSEGRRQRIGALALVAVGLFFIWRSLADLPFGTIDNPGPGITPLALAILLIVCALWSMAGGVERGRRDPKPATPKNPPPTPAQHATPSSSSWESW